MKTLLFGKSRKIPLAVPVITDYLPEMLPRGKDKKVQRIADNTIDMVKGNLLITFVLLVKITPDCAWDNASGIFYDIYCSFKINLFMDYLAFFITKPKIIILRLFTLFKIYVIPL